LPYQHYTMMVQDAQIELAWLRGDYQQALSIVDMALAEMTNIVRGEVAETMGRRGDILLALGRPDEALQTLTAARALAEELGAKQELWPVLASLAEVQSKLGRDAEAKASRGEAREIVEGIAEGLRELGMREGFMALPRVSALFAAGRGEARD
jgi:tetratricopeptide (TPR) repeat protein